MLELVDYFAFNAFFNSIKHFSRACSTGFGLALQAEASVLSLELRPRRLMMWGYSLRLSDFCRGISSSKSEGMMTVGALLAPFK